jgi:Flp pilus assembly pilin Flp
MFLARGNDQGAVLVEYTAVFAFVSIGLAIAIVKLGPVLLVGWDTTRQVLLSNSP